MHHTGKKKAAGTTARLAWGMTRWMFCMKHEEPQQCELSPDSCQSPGSDRLQGAECGHDPGPLQHILVTTFSSHS